jgi:hypothetical protein
MSPQPSIYIWSTNGGGTITPAGLFTATSTGGPYVITATHAALSGIATLVIYPPTYATWAAEENLTGPDAEETADPDHDGLENLLEYATGSDPATHSPVPYTAQKQATNLIFTYTKNKAAPDITYTVEWSSTLTGNDWTTTGTSPPTISADNGTRVSRQAP